MVQRPWEVKNGDVDITVMADGLLYHANRKTENNFYVDKMFMNGKWTWSYSKRINIGRILAVGLTIEQFEELQKEQFDHDKIIRDINILEREELRPIKDKYNEMRNIEGKRTTDIVLTILGWKNGEEGK